MKSIQRNQSFLRIHFVVLPLVLNKMFPHSNLTYYALRTIKIYLGTVIRNYVFIVLLGLQIVLTFYFI